MKETSSLFYLCDAFISPCGLYRYWLSRTWDPDGKTVAWIMLNPSTADANVDDPTIRKCCAFARRWGYGGIKVMNLFAYRATNPKAMRWTQNDIVGPDNDLYLRQLQEHSLIVAAWGKDGGYRERDRAVVRLLGPCCNLVCLGTTKDGQPKHPLYIAGNAVLAPYQVSVGFS